MQANNTIFVSKLSETIKQEDLENFFGQYGEIEKITIPKNQVSGIIKGFAFIQFKKLEDAITAYEHSHKKLLFDREILVDYVRGKNQEWIPRRSGGGLGGEIKSGQYRSGGREKRNRYHREYDDYEDPRHKRYRDYDRGKPREVDERYYERRDHEFQSYDKKYYAPNSSAPSSSYDPRHHEYDRYDRQRGNNSYYESFDNHRSYERDDRRYSDRR